MKKITKKRISLVGLIVLGLGAGVLVGAHALKRRKSAGEEQSKEPEPPRKKGK